MPIFAGILALAIALFAGAAAAEPQNWQLAKDQDGIQIYLTQVPGSGYRGFRGVTKIRADIPTLSALQENLRVACAWLYGCKQMRLLKNDGDDTWVYLTTDLPWPAITRDMVLWVHTEQREDGSLVRQLEAVREGWVPRTPGLIRVSRLQGVWKMVPRGEALTEVTYELQADPAGDIPAWLANRFVVDAPWETLRTLRVVAERQGPRAAVGRSTR
ncbi:START domain-containing protein [Pseudomonas sp. NPDC089530]|uniref:START domain-containing protein n=1 Tax=Pseudomonas sp. NPDC089530 TaxID=3390651 RepID=UPI003D08E6AF